MERSEIAVLNFKVIQIHFHCSSDEDELKVEAEEKLTWTDQVRMIHMRRYLNELADKVEHKDHELQKLRYNRSLLRSLLISMYTLERNC